MPCTYWSRIHEFLASGASKDEGGRRKKYFIQERKSSVGVTCNHSFVFSTGQVNAHLAGTVLQGLLRDVH